MTRLETLEKLEATLEGFLSRIVDANRDRLTLAKAIGSLDDIARDSLRGRRVNSRLGAWFAKNSSLMEDGNVAGSNIETISNLLGKIETGLDNADPESKKLAEEINRWRAKGTIPGRKLILKTRSGDGSIGIADKYRELLNKEAEYFGEIHDGKRHLLSILDDVLKSANAKEDLMYIHLAGSIIYYLKMKGYKVGPFVKRLKEIEESKMGRLDVG
jgi:hypothetical protein